MGEGPALAGPKKVGVTPIPGDNRIEVTPVFSTLVGTPLNHTWGAAHPTGFMPRIA